MTHDDNDPVIFGYSSSTNISFQGSDESGYTYGEWQRMSKERRARAYEEFMWNQLGMDIYVDESEAED